MRKAGHMARGWSLTIELQNTIGSGNHLRKLLEKGIGRGNIGDTHKEMFEALNINVHDLGDQIGDLIILQIILVYNKYQTST